MLQPRQMTYPRSVRSIKCDLAVHLGKFATAVFFLNGYLVKQQKDALQLQLLVVSRLPLLADGRGSHKTYLVRSPHRRVQSVRGELSVPR